MATRGSSKALSIEQEGFIAALYVGKRSPSSGGADNDQGDVRTDYDLIECKVKGGPGKPTKSALITTFEKIAEEAYSEGREPVLALRFFMPDSILADQKGWVDITVRRTAEDAARVASAWKYDEIWHP